MQIMLYFDKKMRCMIFDNMRVYAVQFAVLNLFQQNDYRNIFLYGCLYKRLIAAELFNRINSFALSRRYYDHPPVALCKN